jgi:predicted Fe-Mo cluster-binding NifX family protein
MENKIYRRRCEHMRVAISTDGDVVSAHFGRCPSFTVVDIEGNEVVQKNILVNPGHQPGLIPQFLHQKGVECIVAGGMGMRARGFFAESNIKTLLGVSGRIDYVIEELKTGTLKEGESFCKPGAGKGYGIDKAVCDHPKERQGKCKHEEGVKT